MKKHPKSKPANRQKQVCRPVVVTYVERPEPQCLPVVVTYEKRRAPEQEEPRDWKESKGTVSGATGAAEDPPDEP